MQKGEQTAKKNHRTSLMHAAKRNRHAMKKRDNAKDELRHNRAKHQIAAQMQAAPSRLYRQNNHRTKGYGGNPAMMELCRSRIFKGVEPSSLAIFDRHQPIAH
jgi:hypothetical protein